MIVTVVDVLSNQAIHQRFEPQSKVVDELVNVVLSKVVFFFVVIRSTI